MRWTILIVPILLVGCASTDNKLSADDKVQIHWQSVLASQTQIKCDSGCLVTLPGKPMSPKLVETNGWDFANNVVSATKDVVIHATPYAAGAVVLDKAFSAAGKNVTTTTTTSDSYNSSTETSSQSSSVADSYNTSTSTTTSNTVTDTTTDTNTETTTTTEVIP